MQVFVYELCVCVFVCELCVCVCVGKLKHLLGIPLLLIHVCANMSLCVCVFVFVCALVKMYTNLILPSADLLTS